MDDGPAARITLAEVLAVFHERQDENEPLTAPEIADALNCSRRTALNKLHELAERGEVTSKKVGGRSRVWWLRADGTTATRIDADDPLFAGDPLFASDDPIDEEDIDDLVYGVTED